MKITAKEAKIIGSSTLSPVCGDAELFFEQSLIYGEGQEKGYLILPKAPVLILQETGNQLKLVLEYSEVFQKLYGDRQSAVIIDENSSAYGFIAADMRFRKIDGSMPFLAARPFKTRPGRHDLCGHLDLSKVFDVDDIRLKVNNAIWRDTFNNFGEKNDQFVQL